MLRIIAGIIVGWIAMAILVMATFGIAMLALGWDGVVQPNSWWTTDAFNIIVLIGGLVGAIVGGAVCVSIARNAKAAFALAAVVIAMGIGSVMINMNKPDPPARTEPATMAGMAEFGKEPTWFSISKTVVGVVGVMIGASLVSRASAVRPQS